jgi:hypothetical protein
MKKRSRSLFLPVLPLLLCSQAQPGAAQSEPDEPVAAEPLVDGPLADYRAELLDLAFDAVSGMPLSPHVKNRSRAQELVVQACLELDQPQRALAYIEEIVNWRRGSGYADLAYHCAQRGDKAAARKCLDLARGVLESGELQAEQAWRKDHIRSKIARTYLWLGESRQAAPFEAQLVDSEIGNVQAAKARLADPDSLEERFAALDQLVSAGNLDQVRAAIDSYTELFDRFYDQEERRSKIQQQLLEASKKLPPRIGLELRMDLAGLALEHGDRDHALGLVEDAYLSFESGNWDAENHVPFAARLAGLRYRAGEEQRGRVEAKVALARFDAERNTIIDVLRTEVLIPLAEAYQAMGDDRSALAGYGKALDEAVINPNSRPRAENLAAICLSMARNAVQPTDELRERLSSVAEKLGDPW